MGQIGKLDPYGELYQVGEILAELWEIFADFTAQYQVIPHFIAFSGSFWL